MLDQSNIPTSNLTILTYLMAEINNFFKKKKKKKKNIEKKKKRIQIISFAEEIDAK